MKTLPCLILGVVVLLRLSLRAETNAPGTFLLKGKVVDADGRPVIGAVVEHYQYGQGVPLAASELELCQAVTTDASGGWELRTSRVSITLVARKAGQASSWKQFNARPGATHTLTLARSVSLGGVVVDDRDQPVAGADVAVAVAFTETAVEGGGRSYQYLSGKPARACFHTRTGPQGQFRIEDLPAEASVALAVFAPGKALKTAGQPLDLAPETLPFHAGRQDLRLVLESAGNIEGKIVGGRENEPAPRALLTLRPEGPSFVVMGDREPVESSATGAFGISDVAAGSYWLGAVFGTNTVPDWVAEAVPVTVEAGQTTRGVQVTATRGGLLELVAVGGTNRSPLPSASFSAHAANHQATAISGRDGVARLRLPAGEYQLSGSREDWRSENTTATVEHDRTNRVEVELSPPPKVSGVVRRPDGEPAAGLAVQIVGDFSPGDSGRQTDAAGRFEVEWDSRRDGPGGMTSCLLIRDTERNLAVAEEIDEDTGPLDLRLAPGLTLTGRVECGGKPVTNAAATLVFWSGNRGMHLTDLGTLTNVPGRFRIPALPPGRRYGVLVSAPGYGQKAIHDLAGLTDAGLQELDPMELKPAILKLAGQVVDLDDKPVSGANVNLQGEDQPSGFARTDKEGRFRFERVCEGPVQLYANVRNSYGRVSVEGGDTNVVLKLGETYTTGAEATAWKLKGTVTDPDGKPAAGAEVTVFPSDASRRVKAGTNGAFSLTWVAQPWQTESGGSPILVVRDVARQLAAAEELPEESTNIALHLKPALVLAGRVEAPDGKPLAAAEVGVWLLAGRTYSQVGDQLTTTDAAGKFEVKTLPVGLPYLVFARAKGHGRSQQQVEPDSEANRIQLEPFVLQVADQLLAGQVLSQNEKPVSGVHVSASGDDQPESSATTDRRGRFQFKVCAGTVRLFASGQNGYGSTTADAGDTNVVLYLGRNEPFARPVPQRAPLEGKPLPDLTALGLAADVAPAGKRVLLCVLDVEQRPSRRIARLLSEQHEALRQGLTVLAVHAGVTGPTALRQWQEANPVPFPVGQILETSEKTRWAMGLDSLPWLILTDAQGRVTAEGFALDELQAKLKQAKP